MFDQVREPTAKARMDTAVEIAGEMESPAYGATTDGELTLDSGMLIDLDTEILFTQPSSELSNWQDIPPNLPLPPPLIDLFPFSMPSSLDFVSLSAHPQLTICGVGSPLVCPSPAPLALSLEDPSTLHLASEAQTPPRSYDPAALPWLPAPSSPPELVSPPGSLVPPAPPWSVISQPPPRDCTPLATPHPFVPLAPLGSSFPPSSTSVAPPRPSGAPSTSVAKPPSPQRSRRPLLHHGSSLRRLLHEPPS